MMRSLWTAASGMKAQQTAMDNLSNNLANINTTGYKKERLEFQSLLYQTIQKKTTDNEGNPKPIGAQVGLGVKVAAISTEFEQGELTHTEGDFDFAIQGNGFYDPNAGWLYGIHKKRSFYNGCKWYRLSVVNSRRLCGFGF